MKNMNEMSKITDVSRETLRQYAKIGLLEPINYSTVKKENVGIGVGTRQPWEYNDNDVYFLFIIQAMRTVGYTSNEVKATFERWESEMDDADQDVCQKLELEADTIIQRLSSEQARLDSAMKFFRLFKLYIKHIKHDIGTPLSDTEVLERGEKAGAFDIHNWIEKISTVSIKNEKEAEHFFWHLKTISTIELLCIAYEKTGAVCDENEKEILEKAYEFYFNKVMKGLEIQEEREKEAYENFIKYKAPTETVFERNEDWFDFDSNEERTAFFRQHGLIEDFCEWAKSIYQLDDVKKIIDDFYGDGTAEYVLQAIRGFELHHLQRLNSLAEKTKNFTLSQEKPKKNFIENILFWRKKK